MQDKAKFRLVLLAMAFVVLGFGIALGWALRTPSKGQQELYHVFEEMAPKKSNEADWQSLKIERRNESFSGVEMPVMVVNNLRPILEAEANTSAQHIGIQNIRSVSVLKTTVWSSKANNAIELDWLGNSIKKFSRPEKHPDFYLGLEASPIRLRYSSVVQIGTLGSNSKVPQELIIKIGDSIKKLPWNRPSFIGECYFFETYRYIAALVRNNRNGKRESLAIIDMEQQDLATLIDLPSQVGTYPPLLLIDPDTDLMICMDLEIAWIVCIDLRSGIDQSKKPWPPPWPHPALGPWHGNDDSRRTTQLLEGVAPPPRPANYP